MTISVVFLLFIIGSGMCQDITLRAPSSRVNCGCQCDNYIFRNCNSVDRTGATWCYVRRGNTCTDTRFSQRRDNSGRSRLISNEACATPRCGGALAPGLWEVCSEDRPAVAAAAEAVVA
ncbi:Uncharacterized protein FKW44_007571 [Caligus rogercresseyi]|uniref:Uncharacterized protein n=1 Tax=Caligus rogercresseyi TaxID=217165 RepID=A0A7T8QTP7_CALRO|nr:Uncharacterized protein FKW44_007571 [Caligus rogercresseyi]